MRRYPTDRAVKARLHLRNALCMVLVSGAPALQAQTGLPSIATAVSSDGHHHHGPAPVPGRYTRTQAAYRFPDLVLKDAQGRDFRLRDELKGRSVVLQFIFTTCTAICPVLSATMRSVQEVLPKLDDGVRFVSITIDPEHDTPRRLKDYGEQIEAGDRWVFLTGTPRQIMQVQKAFDAYYPGNNKMYHQPFTFLRTSNGGSWTRLEGFPGRDELTREYRRCLTAASLQSDGS